MTDTNPTPAEREEWKRMYDLCESHRRGNLGGYRATETLLFDALPRLLAALEACEQERDELRRLLADAPTHADLDAGAHFRQGAGSE